MTIDLPSLEKLMKAAFTKCETDRDIDRAFDAREELNDTLPQWLPEMIAHLRELQRRVDQAEDRVDRSEKALHQIVQWADAYPLAVFPEPDFKVCAEVLKAAGQTLDAVSASNMRHVVEGVGKIARAALAGAPTDVLYEPSPPSDRTRCCGRPAVSEVSGRELDAPGPHHAPSSPSDREG